MELSAAVTTHENKQSDEVYQIIVNMPDLKENPPDDKK